MRKPQHLRNKPPISLRIPAIQNHMSPNKHAELLSIQPPRYDVPRAYDFGPTNSSNLMTASRRATDNAFRRGIRQGMSSRPSAH